MKTFLIVVILTLFLSGCEYSEVASVHNADCFEGVMYLYRNKGVSVIFQEDSTVMTCEEYEERKGR